MDTKAELRAKLKEVEDKFYNYSLESQAEIAELRQDVAFYRCCALCGEIPDDSQKPSIKNKEQE